MKVSLSKEEVEAIVKEHLESKFNHEVVSVTTSYDTITIELGAQKQSSFTLNPNQTLIRQPKIQETNPYIIPTVLPWDSTQITSTVSNSKSLTQEGMINESRD